MKKPIRSSSGIKKDSISSICEDRRFRLAFLALFAVVSFAIMYIFRHYMWPFLFAVVFYIALKPLYVRICRRVRRKWIAATITVSLFVMLIVIPLLLLLLALADQTFEFYVFIAQKFDPAVIRRLIYSDGTLQILLDKLRIGQGDLLQKVMGMLQGVSLDIFSSISGMVSLSLQFIVNFFFMILMLFSIFMEGPRLAHLVYDVLPFPDDIEQSIFHRLREVIKVLVAGNLAIMILQGGFVSIGFIIFGVGMPLLAGACAMIFSLIPVVGTSFVWGPAVIYLLATGHMLSACLLALWCVFWYLLLENWVKAKVFGKKLNFHPLVFFFLLIGSLRAFNLPGIIVGPVLLTLFFALWEIYRYLYIEKKTQDCMSGFEPSRKSRGRGETN
jgi:predicted PurR-regulated permease PerM